MNYAFSQLPQIYRLAILLGANVEVYLVRDDKWYSYLDITGLSHTCPYRIVAEDQIMLEKIQKMVDDFFIKVPYRDYTYYVPYNALKEGNIIIMEYGLGIYVQVQKDGTLMELDRKVAEHTLAIAGKHAYYSRSEIAFMGNLTVEPESNSQAG